MGDFISNNPNGKSDLHQFAPPTPTEPPAETVEEKEILATDAPMATEEAPSPAIERSSPVIPQAPAAQNGQIPPFQGQATPPNSNPYANPNPYPSMPQDPYGYGYGAYRQAPPEKNPKDNYNTAAMILGIVTWAGMVLCCGCFSPFTAIAAIITACMGKENGKFSGKAVAGIVMSIIFLVLFALFMLILALGFSGAFDDPATDEGVLMAITHQLRGLHF